MTPEEKVKAIESVMLLRIQAMREIVEDAITFIQKAATENHAVQRVLLENEIARLFRLIDDEEFGPAFEEARGLLRVALARLEGAQENSRLSSIGAKVVVGGLKGAGIAAASTETERRKMMVYAAYDKHFDESHHLPESEIKKLVAKECRVDVRTVRRYLTARTKRS